MKSPDISDITQRHGVAAARAFVDGAKKYEPPPEPPGAKPETPGAPPEITPFKTFDAGDWEGVPTEPRKWVVLNRIPAGEPGIVSGDGGSGKTKLMLQLAVAVGAELAGEGAELVGKPALSDWIGGIIEIHGPVLVYSAEEKLKEMHRRTFDIVEHRKLPFSSLRKRLHFICDPDDVVLATSDEHKGTVTPTLSLLRLEKTVKLIKPALVIVENAADVYSGNESNRSLVTRFVRKLLGGLAQISEAGTGLIHHPSVAGLQDGSGRSGTTGWSNAGRWRLNLTKLRAEEDRDAGIRQLEVVKANYSAEGEKIRLRWERGVFVPEGTASAPERAAAEAPIDEAFLRCLDTKRKQGINVFAYKGRGYAPALFEGMAEAAGYKSPTLAKAQERLLVAGRIKNEPFGPPSRESRRLVRC
jgi:RecA-family ATPase